MPQRTKSFVFKRRCGSPKYSTTHIGLTQTACCGCPKGLSETTIFNNGRNGTNPQPQLRVKYGFILFSCAYNSFEFTQLLNPPRWIHSAEPTYEVSNWIHPTESTQELSKPTESTQLNPLSYLRNSLNPPNWIHPGAFEANWIHPTESNPLNWIHSATSEIHWVQLLIKFTE